MSDFEKCKKSIHIVLGISNMDENLLKTIKDEFEKKDIDVRICVSKYQKSSIEKYISEHNDVDVLVVSEYLQSSKPYEISDYERLNDISSSLMIIPILSVDRKNTSFINNILSLGIYTALFEDDATVGAIIEMAITGRTRKEARYYYGAETIEEIGNTADITTCVDYISFSGEVEETKDRADHVRFKITDKEFEVVMSRLPKNIRDRLKVFDDYAVFFEADSNKSDNKKNLFPNKIFRSLLPIQEDDSALSSVIKQGVQSAVKKVVIGFAGTQHRIGTTHQAIWFGNYLNKAGYKIAIVESEGNYNKCFQTIEKHYNVKIGDGYFSYKNIDYYPAFNLSGLSKIFLKDYNFVLIDFGMFNEHMSLEFGRCVAQVIVCGSKPWEIPMLESLMVTVDNEEILKKMHYLFMFTPDSEKKDIVKNMDVLSKVFFIDYQANPFDSNGCDAIREILADYLPDEKYHRKERFLDRLQGLFE